MGRYRDAHNDLAASQFDADRHAALWRGLSDAALENWDHRAATYLDRASPVLNRYQPDMQARARIAERDDGAGARPAGDRRRTSLRACLPNRLQGR